MSKQIVLPDSWEHFCELTGRDPNKLPDVSAYEPEDRLHAIADFKLGLVIKYCNGGVLPSYAKGTPYKYEPWWSVVEKSEKPSGLGLSYDDYAYWYAYTGVGPRLAFLDRDHAKHITTHFLAEYEDLYL